MKDITIKELVKDNTVVFDSYRAGMFYYLVIVKNKNVHPTGINDEAELYQFTVPVEDIGGATLLASDKAITYMRWIRKAMQENTLIKIK